MSCAIVIDIGLNVNVACCEGISVQTVLVPACSVNNLPRTRGTQAGSYGYQSECNKQQ
jgi:hypothetical protein